MSPLKKTIIRTGLESLYFTGAHHLMRHFVGGVGVILTLHHVRPARSGLFQPNRLLEVTPGFFAKVVRRLRRSGIDIVSLDEMYRRMVERDFARRFVCITFDDGYRDVLRHAYPILREHKAPFALYIPTSFPDGLGELWWVALEHVIAKNKRVGFYMDGAQRWFETRDPFEKHDAFDTIYWWLRARKSEEDLRSVVRDLCARYGVDMKAICQDLCMDWSELSELARDPLVTVGAHTVNHPILKKVSDATARSEMEMSSAVIEAAIGMKPVHLSYPVGDVTSAGPREFAIAKELGFKTAVTTRPGVLFPEHGDHLMALPRISLNGEYQRVRYVKVLMSGAATGINNRFRHVHAA